MFKRGKIGRFIRYGQFKKSNLFRFYLDRFIGFGFRIYIDYDPEKQECYITVLGRKAMRLFVLHDHIIRNWKVSRDMAKALLNKISYG